MTGESPHPRTTPVPDHRVRSRDATAADLAVVASWIGSQRDCELWAGPGVRFPAEPDALAIQIDMARATNVCLVDRCGPAAFGQLFFKTPDRVHLARVIVRALVYRARLSGSRLATLSVYPDNAAAIALYERFGFRRGERPKADLPLPDTWFMERVVMPALPHRLETPRVLLRRLTAEDAPALHRATGDPAVMCHWHPGAEPDVAATARRISQIEEHWRTHGFGDWAVVARGDGHRVIGFAGLHRIADVDDVNIGYVLARDCWRRGLGSEIARSILACGFECLRLPRIVAVVDPANEASTRLARACGLIGPEPLVWMGHERLAFAITREEWAASHAGDRGSPGALGGTL